MANKIVIIGSGPGGYVAAIRLAQLGAEVTVVEKEELGGTCLNVGCTPTKVLLNTAETYQEILNSDTIGIKLEGSVKVDWSGLQNRKADIVGHLTGGVEGLLHFNGVNVVFGTASFIDNNNILVSKEDGRTEEIYGDKIIIASGSEPFIPNLPGTDLDGVIDSTGALSLEELPEEMVIVGAGVIGTEFGHLFNSLGVKVTMVEMLPYILPPIDREISNSVMENMMESGVEIHLSSKVTEIKKNGDKLTVCFTKNDEEINVSADKVLVSVGRVGVTEGLNLANTNVALDRRVIKVDDKLKTNVDSIYAIGDVTGKNMLAHVASAQAMVAAENIMGLNSTMKYNAVPACVYITPEIASVGITEEEAKNKNIAYNVGKFNLSNNGKALIVNQVDKTIVKIISDKKYGEILGVHIYGPRATELIHEAALAIRLEATIDELVTTIHAHPTVAESIMEAALAVENRAIHAVNE